MVGYPAGVGKLGGRGQRGPNWDNYKHIITKIKVKSKNINKKINVFENVYSETSGQDGGVGRHTVPPRTTKGRTTI